MEKKYGLLKNDTIVVFSHILYRIVALRDFGDVKTADLGGYIEKEENLSHEGTCWVYNNAKVYDNAKVYGDAWICGNAEVYNNAEVFDWGRVAGDAQIYGNAKVYEEAWIYGCAEICGDADISKDSDYAIIKGFGSEQRFSTFFRCKDNTVKFTFRGKSGNIEEFFNIFNLFDLLPNI